MVNLYRWHSSGNDITVSFAFPSYFTSNFRSLMDGVPGKIARAQAAKYTLDSSYPETAPNDYDEVTKFAETGMRLSYNPDSFQAEIKAVTSKFKSAVTHAQQFKKGFRMERSKNLEKVVDALLTKL